MADAAGTTTTPPAAATEEPSTQESQAHRPIVFRGSPQNLVPGVALLFAGIMAFSMGMTDVFFAEATAWTFAIWGALMIYTGLLDINNTYEVTEDALVIRNPMRPITPTKKWDWAHINRLDVTVKRNGADIDHDVLMQVYYTPEGDIAMLREDRKYNANLAKLIVERAGLSASGDAPQDVAHVPLHTKQTYTWN